MMSDNPTTFSVEGVRRSRLSDQVADALLRAIVSGEIAPGQQLPGELELCSRFGVSRTVVRESVRTLASKRLIEVRHGSGMWVLPPAAWSPLDTDIMRIRFERGEFDETWRHLVEACRLFEVEIAALAAERRTEADLVALRQTLGRMREAVEDRERYREADVEFHLHLVRAAHNPVLETTLQPIHALLKAGGLRPPLPEAARRALREHEQLAAAIADADSHAARRARTELSVASICEAPALLGAGRAGG